MYNYPIKRPPAKERKISVSNRGMHFEELINSSNEQYLSRDIAVIYKKPTPIQVVNVDYPMRSMAKITEAYYKIPSTTDYNGLYKGYYIDFDAKQCNSTTSFPLSNIYRHQISHLENVMNHGGIGFILIYFNKLGIIYLLETKDLLFFYNRSLNGGKKSISIDELEKICLKTKESFPIRIPYLDLVDVIIDKMKKQS